MKKLLALILTVLLILSTLTGCGNDTKETTKPSENYKDTEAVIPPTEEPEISHTHNFEATVTAPTCEAAGYTTYACLTCDYSYVSDEISATGHTAQTIDGKNATCTETGLTDGSKCSDCSKILNNQTEIAVKGHSYSAKVTASSCTSEGYTTYTCTACGDTYVGDKVVAQGHTEVTVKGSAATCTKTGLTDGSKCSKCGVVIKQQAEIPATGHSYKTSVVVSSCTNSGYTTHTCSVCNHSYVDGEVSASGHTVQIISSKNATCTESGLTEGKKCSKCGIILQNQTEIAANGHSYKSTVVAPTCTSKGYTVYTCSDCGDSYTANEVNALGHTERTIPGKAATCTATGLKDGTECSTCHTILLPQETIPVKGHSYSSSVTKPTCTSDGYTTYTCTSCSYTYTGNETSATGHTYSEKITSPTCTLEGYLTYTCTSCNYSYTSEPVSALGHSWADATTEAPKTCTVCGVTDGEKLPSTVTAPTLYVNYINVGQGDSILIKVEDCDILIDAGTANYGSTVSNYLKNKGVDVIELMINTHPDADHCGGLTTVLNNYVVEEVWISKDTSKTTAAYKNFISAVSKEGLTAKQPNVKDVFTYENLTLTVLYSTYVKGDSNNSSIVVMLEYGSFKFLFMGDCGEQVETQLVNSGTDLTCDVLKVGHHGSKYSSSSSFLNATGADYGVICVGSNSYGHPTSAALNRLSSAGITTYRTDNNGNVVFSTDGVTMQTPNGTVSEGSGSGLSGGASSGGSSSGSSSSGSSSSGSTSSTQYFIGNTESKVFHLPTCSNLPAASK